MAKKKQPQLFTAEQMETMVKNALIESSFGIMQWIHKETIIIDKTTKKRIPNAIIEVKKNAKNIHKYVFPKLVKHGMKFKRSKKPPTPMHTVVRIPVIESEKGWGRKIDDYMVCLTIEDAKKFEVEFNSKNMAKTVPDWYMRVEGQPTTIDITDKQFKALNKTKDKRMWLKSLQQIHYNK